MRTMKTLLAPLVLFAASSLAGCETDTPTRVVVTNGFRAIPDSGPRQDEVTVYRGWYVTTSFVDPVAPGTASSEQRTIPATDYAYFVLAEGWDPADVKPPTRLIPIRSKSKLSVARGATLQIEVSDSAFLGRCGFEKTLSQSDTDFITQRLFPVEFAGVTFDAATCTPTRTGGTQTISDAGRTDAGATLDAGHDR
jgi:hypothetical protein